MTTKLIEKIQLNQQSAQKLSQEEKLKLEKNDCLFRRAEFVG